ncbi:uncharacterized protein DMENIID0001_038260 [Sergentomyia squamirostris]
MTKGINGGHCVLLILLCANGLSVLEANGDYKDYSEYAEEIDKNVDDYVNNDEIELLTPHKVNHQHGSMAEEEPGIFQAAPPQVHCEHRDRGRICDCGFSNEEATLPRMVGSIAHVTVRNCKFVRVLNGTFDTLFMLTQVHFNNIEHLVLDENSLSFPRQSLQLRVTVSFDNVIIEQIPPHAINGFVVGVLFERCRIGIISPFAVTAIRQTLEAFSIRNTYINRIDHQAFKKFTCNTFAFVNNTVRGEVPSRSFYDLATITSLQIMDNNFTSRIHARAFDFQEVSLVLISRNNFAELSGESFIMASRNMPMITENNITLIDPRAFSTIIVEREVQRRASEPIFLDFSRNRFNTPEQPQPLQFAPEFRMIYTRNEFIEPITCEQISRIQDNQFFREFSSETYFRINDYLIDGQDLASREDYHSFAYIVDNFCLETSYFWYIVLGVGLFILLLLVLLIIILCVWWRRRKARQLEIIKPEGKTYRETQIVMQIENHGLLKTEL